MDDVLHSIRGCRKISTASDSIADVYLTVHIVDLIKIDQGFFSGDLLAAFIEGTEQPVDDDLRIGMLGSGTDADKGRIQKHVCLFG